MSDIRAALERLIELHNADGAWGLHWTDAIAAARAALAEPVGEGPSEEAPEEEAPEKEAAIWYNSDIALSWQAGRQDGWDEALACWGCATPPAPEPGEVGELVADLSEIAQILCGMEKHRWAAKLTRAAALLSQQAAPAPVVVPVPVAERPWELEAVIEAPPHCGSGRIKAAAALRAVADQVVAEPPDCGPAFHDYNKGAEDRQRLIRFRLLAIADELEVQA